MHMRWGIRRGHGFGGRTTDGKPKAKIYAFDGFEGSWSQASERGDGSPTGLGLHA